MVFLLRRIIPQYISMRHSIYTIQTKRGLLGYGMLSLVGQNCVDRVIMVGFTLNFFIELLKGYFCC